jgi:hypothetical protein
LAFEIRSWFALHAGCGLDDLRFAGTDGRGPNSTIIYFTVDGVPSYAVQITARAGLGGWCETRVLSG